MFNPNRSAGEWISLMWRRADMGSGIGIAGHRATTRASEDLSALSAGVTDRLRENLVEMLGAFEASRKLTT